RLFDGGPAAEYRAVVGEILAVFRPVGGHAPGIAVQEGLEKALSGLLDGGRIRVVLGRPASRRLSGELPGRPGTEQPDSNNSGNQIGGLLHDALSFQRRGKR